MADQPQRSIRFWAIFAPTPTSPWNTKIALSVELSQVSPGYDGNVTITDDPATNQGLCQTHGPLHRPRNKGLHHARHYRRHVGQGTLEDPCADLPIITCTEYSSDMSAEAALATGVRGYIMKPADRKSLATRVRKLLDAR